MAEKIGTLADKIGNRLVRYFPGPSVTIKTTTPIVSFTFDDIPQSAWTNGARILEKHGARGTFYIAGTFIDGYDKQEKMITDEGCADLVSKGHELGCHTYSHRKISGFSGVQLKRDLVRSAETLKSFDHKDGRRNFSVPFGMNSLRQQSLLRKTFLTSRGIVAGVNRGKTDPYHLSSVELRPDEAYLNEADRWLDDVLANPGWLIFFTHDVSNTPSFYGCPQDRLEQLVSKAAKSGARIMTVDAAVRELGISKHVLAAAE